MDSLSPPLAFVVLLFAGWVNRQQQAVIDDLLEENRVLRTANGPRRLRLTDDQRRRLAVKGKVLARRRLAGVAGIVTPDTILRWYRTLVAKKYHGSHGRCPGRPRTKADLAALVVRLAEQLRHVGARLKVVVGTTLLGRGHSVRAKTSGCRRRAWRWSIGNILIGTCAAKVSAKRAGTIARRSEFATIVGST